MNTPDETWQALLEGRDAITDLPEGRWEEFLDEPRIAERVAKARTRGGYLTDIKGFDAEFFALSKMEADNIDPQQRMAFELTWEALENARIPASACAVRASPSTSAVPLNDYSFLAMSDPSIAHPYAITGTASSIIANRVSYFYDFRGPSVAVDTACSSSLVAAHQGVQALRTGEADVAIVGGVNALITPLVTVGFDEVGGVLAPDGRIKSFSQDADGYARSEGGGMLVLKRVADARRDGDEILAVIAGSAINHDGRSNGLLAPNPGRAGRGITQGVQGRRYQPARRRLHRGARHRHHPWRPDRGRRAWPRRRQGPARRQARAAGCGEIQCGTPGIGRRRRQPGQDGTCAQERQDSALDQLHRSQPVHRLRGDAG